MTNSQLRQIQRDLHRLAERFVQAKCEVLAVSLPRMIRYQDGHVETIYSVETLAVLAEYDRLWTMTRDRYLKDQDIEIDAK